MTTNTQPRRNTFRSPFLVDMSLAMILATELAGMIPLVKVNLLASDMEDVAALHVANALDTNERRSIRNTYLFTNKDGQDCVLQTDKRTGKDLTITCTSYTEECVYAVDPSQIKKAGCSELGHIAAYSK